MRTRLAWVFVAAAFQFGAPGPCARAQAGIPYRVSSPPAQAVREPPQAYQRLVELGFKEFELGNYAEAESLFLEAYAIFDNARVLRALGMVEYELRKYARCKGFLERALRSEIRPLSKGERAEVEALLAQARAYLARYTVLTQPADAELALDNAVVELNADHSLLLSVGNHTLEARAPGFMPARRELHVFGRQDRTIEIQLSPMQPRTEANGGSHITQSPWLWVGVGVVAIGAGVALAYALQPGTKTEIAMPVTTAQSPDGVLIRARGAL